MYPVSIKGVLLSPQSEVVLLLNASEEWELPGGRIELGESSSATLARWMREQLQLEVRVGAPIDTYLFEALPGRRAFIATYRCQLIGSFEPVLADARTRLAVFPPTALPGNLPRGYRRSIEAVTAELA